MSGWDGVERRRAPQGSYEVVELLRAEMAKCNDKTHEKLDAMAAKQAILEKKIDRWETSLYVIQWVAGLTVGIVAAIAAVMAWAKDHLRI